MLDAVTRRETLLVPVAFRRPVVAVAGQQNHWQEQRDLMEPRRMELEPVLDTPLRVRVHIL